ncbi:MAG: SusC/RagA family TonB-linked outer membrane protein [Cyclobacteriaceae bacterium]|nr:SusC/RagA family TonB-linked outer membrane protein [Cyclobacteriaceae bacterium]
MKKTILILTYLMLMHWQVFSQNVVVQGKVIDEAHQTGLPGVYVLVKGTEEGTVTDMDGHYKLSISSGEQTLVFSYIGYANQEILIGSQTEINVQLEEDLVQLGEVIVTAFNIKQDKRDLNYAAQAIKSEEIVETQQQNIVNSLQGKIAGVQVTSSSGSPGASSSIIIRGGTSISEGRSNEPLFVIDGIIMDNSTFEGSGNRAMDINPDDIESMTVLKGPSAAALYGIGAGNGAIIITTKSGKKGKVQVKFGTTVAFDRKFKTHEVQTTYGRGIRGVADDETPLMWGPAYSPSSQTFNNIDDFFQTGVQQKYDLSVSGGSEKSNFFLSVSDNFQTGIVPGEKYNRFNFLLKGSTKIADNLAVTASVNSTFSKNVRGGSGSMLNVFTWPTDDNMSEYLNPDGSKRWLLPTRDPIYFNKENPYWVINNNLPEYDIKRSISQVFFDWDISEPLKLTYRIGMDQSSQYFRRARVPKSSGSATSYSGSISESELSKQQLTSTLIASYSKMLNSTWDLYAMAGFNVDMASSRSIKTFGSDFLLPNLISINNVGIFERPIQSTGKRRILSGFGEVRLDYKGIASIGITGRNDWTSTIAPGKNSFFYPSLTAGFVFTELLNGAFDEVLSFGKIRASWAQAGQDAPIESLSVVLTQYDGLGGGYKHHFKAGNPDLIPEFIQSLELGLNLAFFNGRLNVDVAYYDAKALDMIISNRVSVASGFVIMTFNTGDMQNKGFEIVLDSKIITEGDLKWDASLNFSRNRSVLSSLPAHISRLPVTSGQIINEARPIALINQPLYAIEGTPYLRNENGNIVIDDNGYPRWGTYAKDGNGDFILNADGTRKVSQEKVYLGNREPDFLLGITNTLSYKQFSLSFLFDIRKGGDIINATSSSMMSSGTSKLLDEERNKLYTFGGEVETPDGFVTNNQEVVLDDDYFRFGYRSVGENFVEDGSWLKLRYIAFTYDMTEIAKKIAMQNLQITITGRNLFMLSNYSGGDPENDFNGAAVGGAGTVGLDYFNVPTTQGITFSLRATF